MKSISIPIELKVSAHYPDGDTECIQQLQSYQLTGSWVRYFLDTGADCVTIVKV